MKTYLRLGHIPPNQKSIDFIKLSLDNNSDFSYFMSIGCIEEAYACIPEECYENGLSCFELDNNDNPILSNEELKKSYELRLERKEPIFYVYGESIEPGRDGEPLVINIEKVEEVTV